LHTTTIFASLGIGRVVKYDHQIIDNLKKKEKRKKDIPMFIAHARFTLLIQ